MAAAHEPAATWDDLSLSPDHRAQLVASAITPAVAVQRGYRTATTIREVKRLGFAESQCLVPGLLIPTYGFDPEPSGYQLKPDTPRLDAKRGKPIKYETPARSVCELDIPPRALPWVLDPTQPLYVTEGVKKGDSGAAHELAIVDVAGVWNWRTEEVMASFRQIPLKGRTCYLAFDSDWVRKPEVKRALQALAAFLRSRGAIVYALCLPEPVPGVKAGLDDYFAAGGTALDLPRTHAVELECDADADAAEAVNPIGLYAVRDGRTCYHKRERDGDVWLPLAEFAAKIAEEVIADDGVSERGEYLIAGTLPDGTPLPPVRVPLASFDGLGWVGRHWGSRAIVSAGMGTRDRLREAIQRLSPDTIRRREFTHPGWRELDGGWHFLHAGGSIGPNGPVAVDQIRLSGAAGRIRLPDPPDAEALRDAVRTSLGTRDVAPDRITAPLFGAVYRAPLNAMRYADLSGWITGPTGAGKSELGALAASHFGDFDRLNLPASWAATPNYLERVAFDFKDILLPIDDFAPSGSAIDVARLHATAERVIRGAGNSSGRGRMNADGSLRPDYLPRALVLGTGEDVPKGQSIRARTVVMEVEPGDVDWAKIAVYQSGPGRAALPLAMAGYLRWLAGRYEAVRDELPGLLARFRGEIVAAGQHPRTPEAIANLALGWHLWLCFSRETGALTHEERETVWARVWAALLAVAGAQAIYHADEEPAARFLTLLRSAVGSGAAHVAAPDGTEPPDAEAWGWQSRVIGPWPDERQDWQPRGARVGWLKGDDLYLDPAASYAVAQRLGTSGAGGLTVTARTLHKRLHQTGHLKTVDEGQGRFLPRVSIGPRRVRVLHLAADSLLSDKPVQPVHSVRDDEKPPESSDNSRGKEWTGFAGDGPEPVHEERNRSTVSNGKYPGDIADLGSSGPVGPNGPVSQGGETQANNERADAPDGDLFAEEDEGVLV
jgi:hypothetical protein